MGGRIDDFFVKPHFHFTLPHAPLLHGRAVGERQTDDAGGAQRRVERARRETFNDERREAGNVCGVAEDADAVDVPRRVVGHVEGTRVASRRSRKDDRRRADGRFARVDRRRRGDADTRKSPAKSMVFIAG